LSGNDERPIAGSIFIDNIPGIDDETRRNLYVLRDAIMHCNVIILYEFLAQLRSTNWLENQDGSKVYTALITIQVVKEVMRLRGLTTPTGRLI
jgi:hypothetical protein